MAYFPLFVEIENQKCVVIGGGRVAERKVRQLLEFGGAVTVIAPEMTAQILTWERAGRLAACKRPFEDSDIEGAALVVAATDQPAVHERIASLCRNRKIPVNVVDVKELCTFFFPAMIKREEVVVAVSTGGTSPALAAKLKRELEDGVPEAYGRASVMMGEYRDYIINKVSDISNRKSIFQVLLERAIQGTDLKKEEVDAVIEEVTAGRQK